MAQMSDKLIDELICRAKDMQKLAYAPYSNFKVGAALLAKNGEIFGGCNIENATYSPSICAERCAIAKAVSEGVREFEAICIVGGHGGEIKKYCYPCGVCCQVMSEFCNPDVLKIITVDGGGNLQIKTLRELMPYGFTLK